MIRILSTIKRGWKLGSYSSSRFNSYFASSSSPRRSMDSLFCGRSSTDEFIFPEEIVVSAKEAMNEADDEKFTNASFSLIRHLETLENNHPLWLNPDIMFNGEGSHLHSSYSDIFSMCLLKTVSTVNPQLSPSSNYSGHYFVGPRGIGKSVMMQTCCLVVGQLLPDTVSMYLDASVEHQFPFRHSLIHLLNERSRDNSLDINSPIRIVLSRAAELKCSLSIFIDEAHVLYKNETDWPDILACITGYRSSVFLSGSDTLLVPCVKLRSKDREFLDKELGKFNHETLNTTKLTQKSISGFTTREQYVRFFKSRPNTLSKLCSGLTTLHLDQCDLSQESDLVRKEIDSLHSLTGGRLRTMHALRQGHIDYSVLLDFKYPITNQDRDYLQPFFVKIGEKGFDPFDLPRLHVENDLPEDVVYHLLQKKLISYVNPEEVTLASPSVYLTSQDKQKPWVFISHSESDKEIILDMVQLLKSAATVVCSSDQFTRSSLSQVKSQSEWESEQLSKIGKPGHYVITVLSSTYCNKVDKGGNVGVVREWNLISKLPLDHPSSIYAYLGKHAENVKGNVLTHLRDKPLLRFAPSDLKAFYYRLTHTHIKSK
jgi:hypothetical protein